MAALTRGHADDGDEGEQSLAEHDCCGGLEVDVCMYMCVCVVRGVSAD